jgi:GntR family transcriptional regulator
LDNAGMSESPLAPESLPDERSRPQAGAAVAVASPPAAPSFSPLYQQIKALLLRSLQGGEWLPGQAIPSELDLAARFKVSQGTVRKAIDEMAAENLLVRRQGKGTFVATHAEARTQYRFLRLTPDAGTPSGLSRRLLDCRRLRPPAQVARALQLGPGDSALQIRRLLLAVAAQDVPPRPVVLDDLWLPGPLFKGLTQDRLQAWRGPMYQMFESEFSVRMIRAEEQLRAVAARPEDALQLAVPPGTPLLSVERLSYTYGDKPVEFRHGLYLTDRHHYRNELG